MQDYGTELKELFPAKITQKFLETSIHRSITNDDYEGEIQGVASKLNIFSMGDVPLRTYANAAMTNPDSIQESIGELVTDQKKSYYFKVQSIQKFLSQVKDPESTQMARLANQLKIAADAYILGLYGDVAAGNRIGTDYVTGTVEIDVDGVVTGTGTTFTAAMVGKPFKATGHTEWYRVATRTSNTAITIVDDLDDTGTGTYSGGVIAAGATYTIQANTAVQVTKASIYGQIVDLGVVLDKANVPDDGRWLVVPPEVYGLFQKSEELNKPIAGVHDELVKRGYVGQLNRFMIFKSNQVAGDSVNGWHILAGHKAWCTFAMGFTESGIEDIQGDFGKAYKGLSVYGAKVVDQNRPYAAELFGKL